MHTYRQLNRANNELQEVVRVMKPHNDGFFRLGKKSQTTSRLKSLKANSI